jgi:hypothetical protein
MKQDEPKYITLVRKARLYVTSADPWFIPPGGLGGAYVDGSTKNSSGAVSWSQYARTDNGQQETISSFNRRLGKAGVSMQANWYGYLCIPDAGYPKGDQNTSDPNNSTYCNTGFLCYVLVARAMQDAGYSIDPSSVGSCDAFSSYQDVTSNPGIGDLVIYDWDVNGVYDHVGIITSTSGFQTDYLVISALQLWEHFSYGAAEKRLGIFGTSAAGGDFIYEWSTDWNNYHYKIVRPS